VQLNIPSSVTHLKQLEQGQRVLVAGMDG